MDTIYPTEYKTNMIDRVLRLSHIVDSGEHNIPIIDGRKHITNVHLSNSIIEQYLIRVKKCLK